MKRMYIILFVLNNSAFRRNVNESIELWLTHSGQKKAKEPKQDQPQCNKEQARDASLQQSKHISWFGWSKGGNDQTIICYKKVCVSNRISMENDYLCFCVWVTSTAAQSQTNCFELNTSTRLHITERDAKRCNECSNSSVVLFVIVAAIDDYIPKINTILAALNFDLCWRWHPFIGFLIIFSLHLPLLSLRFSYAAPQWYSLCAWTCQVCFNRIKKIWFNADQLRFCPIQYVDLEFFRPLLDKTSTNDCAIDDGKCVTVTTAAVIEATFPFIFNTSNRTKEQHTRMTSNHVL